MSYCMRYDGEITIFNDKCKSLIKNILLDNDGAEYGNALFESKLVGSTLTIDEDRRNYEGEMESIFALIVKFDKKANGIIIAEGEDGNEKERFTLKSGKVFKEEGFIDYRNKEDITEEPYDLEELEEQLKRYEGVIKCDKCDKKISPKFVFENRGYYDEIIENTKFKKICEKCYKEFKIPFAKKRKIEKDLIEINEEVGKLK